MKILIVGASGTIGRAVVKALGSGNEVVEASRNGNVRVDLSDPKSIRNMYEAVGKLDAIVSTAGSGQFGPLNALSDEDFDFGLGNKLMGQVNLVRYGLDFLNDGGSITLTSGILAEQPNAGSVLLTTLNSAVECFVRAAALDLPRSIRLNAVSPPMVKETAQMMGWGNGGVPVNAVAQSYIEALEGEITGEVLSHRSSAERLAVAN